MPKRVLVVDDELHIRHILRLHLEAAGIDVLEAASGQEALQVAQAAEPDVVILDLGLPDFSGVVVFRRLRQDPRLAGVPVIILTALGEDETVCKGASEFVTKPFSARDLVEMVERCLSQGGGHGQLAG